MKRIPYIFATLLTSSCLAISAHAQVAAETFNFTGASQPWVVPAGVTSIHIEANGAEGHNALDAAGNEQGGEGGYAVGDLAVTPGEVLTIMVGGHGLPAVGNQVVMGGGFNGGGDGMNNTYGGNVVGGGGGASDIRQGGSALANRVIVAGGGGGATSNTGTHGGHGGGLTGDSGGTCCGGDTATGGSQVAGGTAGGSLGQGGSALAGVHIPWIGGGGGGYYGGGTSTAHSGGAGGSSYIGGVTSGTTTTGGNTGDGLVVISYTIGAVAPAMAVPSLGQWGLIVLATLILCVGVLVLRRKRLVKVT